MCKLNLSAATMEFVEIINAYATLVSMTTTALVSFTTASTIVLRSTMVYVEMTNATVNQAGKERTVQSFPNARMIVH